MENTNVLKKIASSENLSLLAVTIFAIVMRLVPHVPNVAPVTGLAIFAGAYASRKKLVLPLVTMLISDIFLGFHNTMIFVYGSFLVIGLMSSLILRTNHSVVRFIGASVASSLLFYVVTNFGVWMMTDMYSKDFQGLITCYVYGLPFLRFTVLGDLLYTGVFAGGFEAMKALHIQLAKKLA